MKNVFRVGALCALGIATAGGCSNDSNSPKNGNDAGNGNSAGKGNDAGSGNGNAGTGSGLAGGPGKDCKASSTSEAKCSDGKDDDCDGFADCLDPDCEGISCGAEGSGRSCLAGACLGAGDLPPLPRINNVVATIRGDTAIVDFSAVEKALDYRVYPLPADPKTILVGDNGEVSVKDGVYRCGGAMPRDDRMNDDIKAFDASLTPTIHGYTRKEDESVLGYVFLTPKDDREPVYRVANPNQPGGFAWETGSPPAKEYNGAEYVVGTEARDALLAEGFRDDGIAFYTAKEASKSVYRGEFPNRLSVFYTEGAEAKAHEGAGGETAERFKILAEPTDDSVPLYRIFYAYYSDHDILAAGNANRDRTLRQGNLPITSLTWSGLKEETTLVIEALDTGCPWPGGFLGPVARAASTPEDSATVTVEQARLSSGELFVNGQYDSKNRPKPIARSYVTVKPEPHPEMDWFESFEEGSLSNLETVVDDNIGTRVFRNDKLSVEFHFGGSANYYYGELFNQMVVGSSNTLGILALGANAKLTADKFLHVTAAVDIASTLRRYPQIMITDTPVGDPATVPESFRVPIVWRMGPTPQDKMPPGPYHTIIVQPFTMQPELQIEFCDLRGWGVSQQCPRANVYGFHAGAFNDQVDWQLPWLPTPVLGEYVGMDRLVKWDVYASINEVYVFVEDKPAGCAIIPEGRFPAGDVNVNFGIAAYHIDADEFVTRERPRAEYWSRTSTIHTDRKLDDLGIKSGVSLPPWDSRFKCGDRYYGEQK